MENYNLWSNERNISKNQFQGIIAFLLNHQQFTEMMSEIIESCLGKAWTNSIFF